MLVQLASASRVPLPSPGSIPGPQPKLWVPRRVLVTPAAREWPLTGQILHRASSLGAEIISLTSNRLTGLTGDDERATYARAKTTLALVTSPPSKRKPQPIPPSADWQFHLAAGCPAHCQYCYLAGSLEGPPVTRVFVNLPEILDALRPCVGQGTITSRSTARAAEGTTFECSCYTDPLALEHLTGSLSETIRYFGAWDAPVQLRWTTKFDNVEPLLALPHNRRTRVRASVNTLRIARLFEGGTANVPARLLALRRLALAGYPVGLTIAPIMPEGEWRAEYGELLRMAAHSLEGVPDLDLTVELITHRFTPGSKAVLQGWYPKTTLDLDEARRASKRTKFGTLKHVYPTDMMRDLRAFFEKQIAVDLPAARILYWT